MAGMKLREQAFKVEAEQHWCFLVVVTAKLAIRQQIGERLPGRREGKKGERGVVLVVLVG